MGEFPRDRLYRDLQVFDKHNIRETKYNIVEHVGNRQLSLGILNANTRISTGVLVLVKSKLCYKNRDQWFD